MRRLLLDTNAYLYWHREPHRLTAPARAAMQAAVGAWGVSAITFVELKHLLERGRIEPGLWADAVLAASPAVGELGVLPVTLAVADAMDHVPRRLVADMPDRPGSRPGRRPRPAAGHVGPQNPGGARPGDRLVTIRPPTPAAARRRRPAACRCPCGRCPRTG